MKTNFYSPYFTFFLLLVWALSSCQEKRIDFEKIHIYQSEEAQKLMDNALKIDMIGEPTVQVSESVIDSTRIITQTTTTQTYLVYVGLTMEGQLILKSEIAPSQVSAMLQDVRSPVVINTACEMKCLRTGMGYCEGARGCRPDHAGGCTAFNCGSGCTTSGCRPLFQAFGFERIRF